MKFLFKNDMSPFEFFWIIFTASCLQISWWLLLLAIPVIFVQQYFERKYKLNLEETK